MDVFSVWGGEGAMRLSAKTLQIAITCCSNFHLFRQLILVSLPFLLDFPFFKSKSFQPLRNIKMFTISLSSKCLFEFIFHAFYLLPILSFVISLDFFFCFSAHRSAHDQRSELRQQSNRKKLIMLKENLRYTMCDFC